MNRMLINLVVEVDEKTSRRSLVILVIKPGRTPTSNVLSDHMVLTPYTDERANLHTKVKRLNTSEHGRPR